MTELNWTELWRERKFPFFTVILCQNQSIFYFLVWLAVSRRLYSYYFFLLIFISLNKINNKYPIHSKRVFCTFSFFQTLGVHLFSFFLFLIYLWVQRKLHLLDSIISLSWKINKRKNLYRWFDAPRRYINCFWRIQNSPKIILIYYYSY